MKSKPPGAASFASHFPHFLIEGNQREINRRRRWILGNVNTFCTYVAARQEDFMKRHFVVCLGLLLLVVAPQTANAQRFTYVTNFGSSSVSVIDMSSNTVAATVSVGGNPYGIAITPDGSRLYVANQSSNSVSVIDTASNTVVATVAVESMPTGVAVAPDGSNVYVTNYGAFSSSVSVISTASNMVVATVSVGNNPSAVVVTPDGTRAYVVNSSGASVSVINTATDAVDTTVSIAGQPYWIALTPDGSHAYVTNRSLGSVSVIDTATETVTATINVGSVSYGVAVTPGGTQAWVTNLFSNSVSVVDTATNTVASTISSVSEPYGIAFSPDGTLAYVTDRFGTSVSVISTATGTISSSIPVGSQPVRVAITPTTNVTSLADDGSPGTLRYAIANANAGDTITFSVTGTITLTQGELELSKNVTIRGPGVANLAISGNHAYTVFQIDSGVSVSISGVTMQDGLGDVNGGDAANYGTLTASDCTLLVSTPSNGNGGGLYNAGTANVTKCTFAGNPNFGVAAYGGGIYNSGTLTVTSSTFENLNVGGAGGGIDANSGTVTVINSTFWQNTGNVGGAISSGANLSVVNSTLAGNGADQGGGIYAGNAGAGPTTIKNTLLAGNHSSIGGNCKGETFPAVGIVSDGYNLSDDVSCDDFLTATGDLNNTPAQLDPNGLKDYGGFTFTVALQSTSPAVDAIPQNSTNYCTDIAGNPITTDQRGVARPQGAQCDIGAYELDRTATLPALASSINPSSPGAAVTFTATVSATSGSSVPTGTVTFYDGPANLGTAPLSGSNRVSLNSSTLSSGTHSITAVYSGDTVFAASTSAPLTQTVRAASSISVGSSLNPSIYGQSVTFTATVTASGGVPTGTVTFSDGPTMLGTGVLNGSGQAVLPTTALSAGSHTIIVAYSGDSTFAASTSSPLTQNVNHAATSTVITSSLNPSTYGQPVTLSASVTSTAGSPTGIVTFYDGATALGTATLNGSGQALLTTAVFSAGTNSLSAAYGGDSNFATSTSGALGQTVSKATTLTVLTGTPNPSSAGQTVAFVATVSGQYGGGVTGTVTFNDGQNKVLGTASVVGGSAGLSVLTLGTGTHSVTAVYGGDGNSLGSTSPVLSQSVVAKTATTTTVSSSLNPSYVGQLVTFTATVTPSAATGTVTFKRGQTVLGTGTLTGGQATFSTSSLSAGLVNIVAAYGGDAQYAGSNSTTITETVNKAATTTVLISVPNPSSVGQLVTFTATVTSSTGATPNGTVTFNQGGTSLGTATIDASGDASFSTSTLSNGKNNIKAVYGGSSAFAGSTSAATQQVVQ
jgi:YVTN family beta-propeller protein